MNYYPFHIGDFRSGTANMSRLQRAIYRDLLDIYYDTEKPLSLDMDQLYDAIGAEDDSERRIVDRLLRFKFIKKDDGHHHEICDKVIAEYHAKAEIAKANGRLGGRPSKAKPNQQKPSGLRSGSNPVATANPVATGSQANQEPITNINTPIPPEGGDEGLKSTKAISFPEYLARCKDAEVLPIPEKCSVFDYAEKVGISKELLRLQWLEFKDRYSEDGAKKYKAWATVFCKSVRGNWFKLWYADKGGGYALTTAGVQAEANHKGTK